FPYTTLFRSRARPQAHCLGATPACLVRMLPTSPTDRPSGRRYHRPMRRLVAHAALAAIVLPALAAPVAAQEAPAPQPAAPPEFADRVEVEIVNVDVIVVDRNGRPVSDLTRSDFELRIDGQPTDIDYSAAPALRTQETATPAAAPATTPEAPASDPTQPPATETTTPSQVLVFVDLSALSWKTSDTIVEEIRDYLLTRTAEDDRILVAAFADTLRILADATGDRSAVLAALDELEEMRGRGTRIASERTLLEREVRNFGLSFSVDPEREQNFIEQESQRLRREIEQYGREELDRQRRSIAALEQ